MAASIPLAAKHALGPMSLLLAAASAIGCGAVHKPLECLVSDSLPLSLRLHDAVAVVHARPDPDSTDK